MARRLKKYVVPSFIGTLGLCSIVGTSIYIKETTPVKSSYKIQYTKNTV